MASHKIDLLLKYALAVAGQEDPGNRELGPIHLLKYVYLGDLAYSEKHQGQTFTGAQWRFHHFGPWALGVFQRIEPVVREVGATERKISSYKLEDDYSRWTLIDDALLNQLDNELPHEITHTIKRLIHQFGDDTSSLLAYVYRTRPMLRAAPGEMLSFDPEYSGNANTNIKTIRAEYMESKLSSKRAQKRRKASMQALKNRVQEKLSEKRDRRRKSLSYTPPRYDDVFFEGVKWLDSPGGEPIGSEEGQLSFSEDIWKSPARTESDEP